MMHKMFTIRDAKSECFLQPFFLQTRGQAVRVFADCVADKNHQFARHPEDYSLYELGEYDDTTATLVTHKEPEFLNKAIEFQSVVAQIHVNEPALPLEMQSSKKVRGPGRPPKDEM